jgi:hypothetical protein
MSHARHVCRPTGRDLADEPNPVNQIVRSCPPGNIFIVCLRVGGLGRESIDDPAPATSRWADEAAARLPAGFVIAEADFGPAS